MNRLIVIGAGGHGKVIADNAIKNGYVDISFIDDQVKGECMGFPIIGTSKDIISLNDGLTDFIIGIGNNTIRKKIAEKYDVQWTTLIHPSVQLAKFVEIEEGTVIMAGSVINTGTKIGKHCIINTGSIIEHDNQIKDYVHISPGVKLSGTVEIGESSWIGTGTSIINNISIGNEIIIGVGSVVIRDINKKGTYYGVVKGDK